MASIFRRARNAGRIVGTLQSAFRDANPLTVVPGVESVMIDLAGTARKRAATLDSSTFLFAGDVLYDRPFAFDVDILGPNSPIGIAALSNLLEGIVFFDSIVTGPDG